ncbi:MAG: TlyA family rRNA (cytidine-2'-O)-methyltransferase, partial [Mucispirillum sp.]|nr:TlyA family rRNA (cytidine-2'-O)-methyltransferase [Mucispirillum sp.]
MKKKQRMDEMLIEKGFAASGDEALRLIMAGVAIADDKRIDKAGELVSKDAVIRLKERLPYVSRGGLKLKQAVDTFKLDMKNALVMDIGASTGGFTDVALQEGADTVIAVDCGIAQLHNKLLADKRVRSYENTNFKYFDFDNVGKYCDC